MSQPSKLVKPPIEHIEFRPDWSKIMTAHKSQIELIKFRFRGPGWYYCGNDTMLVVPAGQILTIHPWMQNGWSKDQLFWFHVWNNCDPSASFNAIANAPVKEDDR